MDESENKEQEFLKDKQNIPNKNIIGIVVLIIVLLIGGYFVFKNNLGRIGKEEQQEIKKETTIIPKVTQSPKNQLPKGFPENIPLNGKKDDFSGSYSLNYQGVEQGQKVIDFTSSKSVKDNFDFYKNWAKKNNWNILGEPYTENEARLILEQDNKFLNITIQIDEKETSKININYY